MSKNVFADTIGVYLYNGQQNSSHLRSNGEAEDKLLSSLYDAGAEYGTDYVTDEYGETAGKVAEATFGYGKEKAGLGTGSTSSSTTSSSVVRRMPSLNQKFFYGRLQSPAFIENQWGVRDVDVSWNTRPQNFEELAAFKKSHISNAELGSQLGVSSDSTALKSKLSNLFFKHLETSSTSGVQTIADAVKLFIQQYPFVSNVRIRVDSNAPAWRDLGIQRNTVSISEKSVRPLRANALDFFAGDSFPSRFGRESDYWAYLRSNYPAIKDFIYQVVPQFQTHAINASDLEAVARAVGKKFGIDVHIGNQNGQVRYISDTDRASSDGKPYSAYVAITSAGQVSSQADVERILKTPGRGIVPLLRPGMGILATKYGSTSSGAEATKSPEQDTAPEEKAPEEKAPKKPKAPKKSIWKKPTTWAVITVAVAGVGAFVLTREK